MDREWKTKKNIIQCIIDIRNCRIDINVCNNYVYVKGKKILKRNCIWCVYKINDNQ